VARITACETPPVRSRHLDHRLPMSRVSEGFCTLLGAHERHATLHQSRFAAEATQSRNSRFAQSGQYVTGFGGLSDVK
jgi:hypothetical protein